MTISFITGHKQDSVDPRQHMREAIFQKIVGEVIAVLPFHLQQVLLALPHEILSELEEIRLRQGRPLTINSGSRDIFLDASGKRVTAGDAYMVTAKDISETLQIISDNSFYALEEELRNGYITIKGGHRVGLAGKAVVDQGRVKTLKFFAGVNIRVSKEIIGAADQVMPFLIDPTDSRPYHTLILSPPQCGKTTLLRDIIRQFSTGVPRLKFPGVNVGVVDERSEIAGCYHGVPQKDLGLRADVLDACPKAEGMLMLIRAMSPRVIATDEIGRMDEVAAVQEMLNAGITLLTTVHAATVDELLKRPAFLPLLEQQVFERFIILDRSLGVGTVANILDGARRPLLQKPILPAFAMRG